MGIFLALASLRPFLGNIPSKSRKQLYEDRKFSLIVILYSLSVKGAFYGRGLLFGRPFKWNFWSLGVKFHGKLLYFISLILSNLKAGTFVALVLFTLEGIHLLFITVTKISEYALAITEDNDLLIGIWSVRLFAGLDVNPNKSSFKINSEFLVHRFVYQKGGLSPLLMTPVERNDIRFQLTKSR